MPTTHQEIRSVIAVKAALADMEAGDKGIPADEHLASLRNKFNIREGE